MTEQTQRKLDFLLSVVLGLVIALVLAGAFLD